MFVATFALSPTSFFGLPEGDKTVLKAAGAQVIGAAIDPRTGLIVQHGSVSEFRRPEEVLKVSLDRAGYRLVAEDNFVRLSLEAPNMDSAVEEAIRIVERFVRHLTVEHAVMFDYEALQIEFDDQVRRWPSQRSVHVMSATLYDLADTAQKMARAFPRALLGDTKLDKALLYIEHGWFLYNVRVHAPRTSPHYGLAIASAFLQLWKAVTAILGDPSSDRGHRTKHRQFGLPKEFWNERVKPLYVIRNDADVAHYSLASSPVQKLEGTFGQAALVCRDVIAAYADSLLSAAFGSGAA